MKFLRAVIAISMICLFASCGDSDKGGTGRGGSGGSSGGSMAGAGGGTGGGAGSGSAGTTGAGGTGGGADCPACVTCFMSKCGSQLTTCQANASCNAIYECGRTCATPINTCVAMHTDAIVLWAGISACINANCAAVCGL